MLWMALERSGGSRLQPFDDARRLAVLRDYSILDTPPEVGFDNITRLAAKLFGTPISLISLVDQHRQWFKSRVGLAAQQTSREVSFCDHAVRANDVLVVCDARADARFSSNPLVTGDPNIRFYCGVPLRSAEGECLGTLCLIDRKPRELTAAQLSQLEDLGRLAEGELEVRRRHLLLEQALARQDASQRSKEQLASMIVHDLRSPMTALGLLCSAVTPADAFSKESLDEMLAETERMGGMLTDVLDVCLSSSGALRLRRSDFSVLELAAAAVRRIGRLAQARGQRLDLDASAAPPTFNGDRHLLMRVLENLLGNAVKHGSPDGAITLAVGSSRPGWVRAEVRDAGPRLPEEAREQMFRPFEQGPASASAQKGYGLGLAFCKAAVEAHGGVVGVGPNGTTGNCFFFEVPDRAL